MQFEARSLPYPHGCLYQALSYNPYNPEVPATLPHDIVRLYQEKDILSKGLADCVTYLKALREKRAKNARQLNTGPSAPKGKRKKLQQTKRHLDNEIKNRERDEQAWLNNLQACETNIYLANIKTYNFTHAPLQVSESTSTPTLYTPTLCSYSGSEATDLAWDGWTDEAAVSPFQNKGSDSFIDENDVAPDARAKDSGRNSAAEKDVKRPPPLLRYAEELPSSIPVPPNTAQSHFRRSSTLSPAAPVFEPTSFPVKQIENSSFKRLSMSSSTAANTIGLRQKRRFSAAEIVPIFQRFPIDARSSPQHLPGQTWCNTTPQSSPQKDMAVQMSRHRTNSL